MTKQRLSYLFGIRNLAFLLTVMTTLLACQSEKAKKAPDKVAKLPFMAPNTAVIEIELEPCLGKCPAYKAAFYGNGTMDFEGKSHVSVIGKYHYTFNQQLVKDLVQEAEKANFFKLENEYSLAPDFPVTTITYRRGTAVKTVKTAASVPQELKAFDKLIKETVLTIIKEQPGMPVKD